VLLCALLSSPAFADAKYYSQTGWTRKEGLIGSQIWLSRRIDSATSGGTNDGLVRFDGVRFLTSREIGLAAVQPMPFERSWSRVTARCGSDSPEWAESAGLQADRCKTTGSSMESAQS